MKDWQVREKHSNDVKNVLNTEESRGNLVIFRDGESEFVRRWNGPEITKSLAAAGHTSVRFDTCKCWLNRPPFNV